MSEPWKWLLFVGLLGWLAIHVWDSRPGQITPQNFERIEEGMSREEVEELLGSSGVAAPTTWVGYSAPREPELILSWRRNRDDGTLLVRIFVGFTDEKVVSKRFEDAYSD